MSTRRTALEQTVAGALDRLVPEGRVGLAVSGGPDSLALLLLAAAVRPVSVATVDHRLRTESAAEAALVAALCDQFGVPHQTLRVTVAEGASVQAQAREARYEALVDWAQREGLATVATAHHADDQAETLLMRLARGSGIGGLAGIRERRALATGIDLVRPLLGLRKAELIAVVKEAGLTAVDDPANRDPRHDRTRVRALLAEAEWLDPVRLARSAAALAEAEEVLREAFAAEVGERIVTTAGSSVVLLKPSGLPALYRRWLVEKGLERFGAAELRGTEIDRVIEALEAGRATTLRAAKLVPQATGEWRLEPAPPRRS